MTTDPDDKAREVEEDVSSPRKHVAITATDQKVLLDRQHEISANRDKMPSGIQPAAHESFGILDSVNSESIDHLEALGTPESKQFAEMRREIRRQMPIGPDRDK